MAWRCSRAAASSRSRWARARCTGGMPVSRLITGMEIVGWRRRGMVRFQGYALELIQSTRQSRLKTLFEHFVKLFCETEKDRGKRGSGGRVRSAHLDRKLSSAILMSAARGENDSCSRGSAGCFGVLRLRSAGASLRSGRQRWNWMTIMQSDHRDGIRRQRQTRRQK